MRVLRTLFLVVAIAMVGAYAAATEESELSCQPTEVEINQPITCYIYVRDSLGEPTTTYKTSDFAVRVMTAEANGSPILSELTVTEDPTVIKFTVASSTGTKLRIDVTVKSNGMYIRSSGIEGAVLTWPANDMGALVCDTQLLMLRSSTICTAPLFGPGGVSATVHTSDVYFSEDHGAGSFVFLSGVRDLVFNFTAPASLLAPLDQFVIRVTLSAANRVYTLDMPLAYPALAPSDRTLLRCTEAAGSSHSCVINAADSYGPVLFDPSKFTVTFERIIDGQWTDVTAAVATSYAAGTNAAAATLLFAPKVNNEIYTARVHVIAKGADVLNSPFMFQMGVPPTWSQMSFRGCTTVFLTEGNTTTCTVDVSSGATADPQYAAVSSRLGGVIEGPKFAVDGNVSTITFTYSPPNVKARAEEFLSVTVGGVNIVGSPYRVVVYPTDINEVITDINPDRPAQIVIGVIFFGTILAAGSGVLFKRNRQAARVKQYRSMQAEQQEHQSTRVMSPIVTHGRLPAPSTTTTSFAEGGGLPSVTSASSSGDNDAKPPARE